jgi:DNA-binding transcriptional ArsR family regulator
VSASDAERVLGAAAELTEAGSYGFYASAILARTGLDAATVSAALLDLVEEGKLELSFELRSPDNGRRLAAYERLEEVPVGEEFESDRSESPAPFVVEQTDVFVRFGPTRKFAASLRRRAGEEGSVGGNPGKVRRTRGIGGRWPRLSLP